MKRRWNFLLFPFLTILCASVALGQQAAEHFIGAQTYYGRKWVVSPGDDLTLILEQLEPGDEVVLHEGTYRGKSVLNKSGSNEKPITIRGFGQGERRPVLLWEGTDANLFQVNGSNVVFDYLEFRSKYTYCMRMGLQGKGASNVVIRNNVFYECGGGCISANATADYDRISITDNYFVGPKKTPVYIGSHSGKASVTRFAFEGNVVDGSQIYGGGITGYGIELKLNVTKSVIENNFITNTKGPGIMVYGAEKSNPENANTVRNNIVIGSRNDAGIVVGGGPSHVFDNLILGCHGGIEFMNYGGRNLLAGVVIRSNTVVCNRHYGISFGNNPQIVARDNRAISIDTANAYIRDPGKAIGNSVDEASEAMQTLLNNKLLKAVPLQNNLRGIWLRLSSGPLSRGEVEEIMNLILEYKMPIQVLNSPD